MKKLISLSIFALSTLFGCQGSPVVDTVVAAPSAAIDAGAGAGGTGGATTTTSQSGSGGSAGGVVGTSVPPMCFSPEGIRRLPDPILTPGKICSESDLDFDGFRYNQGTNSKGVAYCRRYVTLKMKMTVAESYGIAKTDFSNYEFDHYIPLAAGGANDISNIWPQPLSDATSKDVIETRVYNGLKAGKITQEEAVTLIRAWKPADCK